VIDERGAPDLTVRQEDLRVVGRDELRHEQRKCFHLARLAGDLHVMADVEGAEQQEHHAGGEVRERPLQRQTYGERGGAQDCDEAGRLAR
jgi:hypothetical protein